MTVVPEESRSGDRCIRLDQPIDRPSAEMDVGIGDHDDLTVAVAPSRVDAAGVAEVARRRDHHIPDRPQGFHLGRPKPTERDEGPKTAPAAKAARS